MQPLLEMRRITKRFPGVLALDAVDLAVGPSEIVALIGENGAGKSTLMKVLGGIHTPDSGEIIMDGDAREITSVEDAAEAGVALIHQELNLADNLTVAENVFLGHEPSRGGFLRLFDRRRAEEEAGRLAARVGLDCPMSTTVSALAPGARQLVEVTKALSHEARILVMDEPTSSLSKRETKLLFGVIRGLKARGVSIVYISHRLGEVREVADRVVVLRDGRNSGELRREEATHDAMVRLMVGRQIERYYRADSARRISAPDEESGAITRAARRISAPDEESGASLSFTARPAFRRARGDVVLEVRDLVVGANPAHKLNLQVRRGEVLGVAGLVGAGRTELARTLFGIARPLSGTILMEGRALELAGASGAIRAGVGLVPEDRRLQGLVIEMTVRENITLAELRRLSSYGFIRQREERARALRMVERLGVRSQGLDQEARLLSGGNQQKLVLAKWLALEPRLLILDEPTRGVDVGAKQEIYHLMNELVASGVAVLMISSEMEEILGMSDRVIVMHEGSIAGELSRDELTEENVMTLGTGKRLSRAG